MGRLIDADRLAAFPHELTSGTEDAITEWIEEIFSTEEIIDHNEDLEKLCWKVINGFIGVIETEPTVDAVEVVRCKDCEYWGGRYASNECSLITKLGNPGYWLKTLPTDYCSSGVKMDGGD